MTNRILAALRGILDAWDRYTVLQFNAPLTHRLLGGAR
jgi:hypothetical protein